MLLVFGGLALWALGVSGVLALKVGFWASCVRDRMFRVEGCELYGLWEFWFWFSGLRIRAGLPWHVNQISGSPFPAWGL